MPLILPSQRLIRPNPLAYPAGAAPGFDPLHPAAGIGSGFSGIATPGGTFSNLMSQAKGTEGGTKATRIRSNLGPTTLYDIAAGTNADSTVFPFTVGASATITLAAIFSITGAVGANSAYILNTAAAGNSAIGDINHGGTFTIDTASVTVDTLVPYAFEVPYFFAANLNPIVTNWVIVRLDTGVVRSGQNNLGQSPAGDGTITVGSRGSASRQMNARIAAAMATNSNLGLPQLLAWAADPWSFWYPNKRTNLVNSAGAAATFLAAWARGSNLPVIGTGNY